MPLTDDTPIRSHGPQTRGFLRLANLAGLVLTSVVLSRAPAAESQLADPNQTADASFSRAFNQASRYFRNFKVESLDEFIKMQNHRQKLLSQGRITHKFTTAAGQLIHCIEIGSQDSV